MSYFINPRGMVSNPSIIVVGCGGTGGFVAEGLCRLLRDSNIKIVLIDYDRVEPHNLRRQHFYEGDLGKYKSQVLAERLSRQYGRRISYSVYPFSNDLIGHNYGGGLVSPLLQGLIIGCVDDSTQARRSISERFGHFNWWIDAGNGYSSGQVLIGNTSRLDDMKNAFREKTGEVVFLPLPTLQLPSLLVPSPSRKKARQDCDEAVAADEQSPVINQVMATLVLQFIHLFFNRRLSWMGTYIDLEAGTLHTVPADPVTVARMFGLKVNSLILKS